MFGEIQTIVSSQVAEKAVQVVMHGAAPGGFLAALLAVLSPALSSTDGKGCGGLAAGGCSEGQSEKWHISVKPGLPTSSRTNRCLQGAAAL